MNTKTVKVNKAISETSGTNRKMEIKKARTCYDHFAGEFGVTLTEAFVKASFLVEGENDFILTDKGYDFFNNFGITIDTIRKGKRSFSRKCLDGTEKKYHLAGALGKAIVDRFFELQWAAHIPGSRAVKISDLGKEELEKIFNFH